MKEFFTIVLTHILLALSVVSLWRLGGKKEKKHNWIFLAVVVIMGAFAGTFIDTLIEYLIDDYKYLLGNFSMYPPLLFSVLFLVAYLHLAKNNTK